jgi:UDPglucose 6-dehydrogenase
MKITVVGAGHVGLALAVMLAERHEVVLLEVDERRVQQVNSGQCPVGEPEMQTLLVSGDLRLRATMDRADAYAGAHWVLIATPTDYTEAREGFDTSSVESVVAQALTLAPQAVLVIRSTVPVGFTRHLARQHDTQRLIFCPEFLREGQALQDLRHPSRLVVGDRSPRGQALADLLLEGSATRQVPVLLTDSDAAEAIKLFSNTYLAMRVAFFNELDTFAASRGLDARQVIEGVCLDPRIGAHYRNPSFGYGGYCLPKDTRQLLSHYAQVPQRLMHAIVQANETRQDFIASDILSRGAGVVGIYRLAMKMGSDNFRTSSVLGVMRRLQAAGGQVIVHQPGLQGPEFFGARVEPDVRAFKAQADLIVANRLEPALADVLEKVYSRDVFGKDT